MADLLRAIVARGDIDLTAFFSRSKDRERAWASDAAGFRSVILGPDGRGGHHPSLRRALAQSGERWDAAILTHYQSPATWMAARWLDSRRIPWLMLAEPLSPLTVGARRLLRDATCRQFLRKASGVLAIGSSAARCYADLDLRIPDERIFPTAYFANLNEFYSLPANPGGDGLRVLTCGQLIARKGHDILLRSFARVASEFPGARLTILGDGPLRESLASLARTMGIAESVRFQGWVEYSRRHVPFGEATVFALATRFDGWGMVVPEAMAAGLPVISTISCGAAVDLVRPDLNGYLCNPAEDEIAAALLRYARDPGLARRHGEAARRLLREAWSPELGAAQFAKAIEAVVGP